MSSGEQERGEVVKSTPQEASTTDQQQRQQSRLGVESLRKKCECEMCLTGKATTHNDEVGSQV